MSEAQDDKPNGNKRGPKGPSKELNNKDFERLKNLVRIQCTQTEICSILDMSDTTLNRRLKERDYENFEDFYKKHNDEGRMSLRRMQWSAAEASVPVRPEVIFSLSIGLRDALQIDR